MKITKWVDMGQEVEIHISAEDIRIALSEAFSEATKEKLGEGDNKHEILLALNSIAGFLNALEQHQLDSLTLAQRLVIEKFLRDAADRFKLPAEVA